MYNDFWGHKYATEEKAIEGVIKFFYENDKNFYYEYIADFFHIPHNIFQWMLDSGIYSNFEKDFHEDIEFALRDLGCDYIFEDEKN